MFLYPLLSYDFKVCSREKVLTNETSMLRDTCAVTEIKYIPRVSLPTKGFQLEYMREVRAEETTRLAHSQTGKV